MEYNVCPSRIVFHVKNSNCMKSWLYTSLTLEVHGLFTENFDNTMTVDVLAPCMVMTSVAPFINMV